MMSAGWRNLKYQQDITRIDQLRIIPYEPHPHVAIIRDFLGYKIDDIVSSDSDGDEYLRSLDPKDWKSQDHYAVLGIKKLRYRATAEEIRKAYRHKLLTHHPDKRRSKGENVKDESHDYFSCITIANDILGNPSRRQAYDSVDPVALDEYVPTLREIKSDFYGPLYRYFSIKSRWSKKQPVPVIGYSNTPIDDVHHFYDFWEEYDTTRDFSFLDEEDKQKGEDREERRAIEKQNRVERARRRADELRVVHQIVALARQRDPRLLEASRAAREAKEARRQARLDAIKQKREAEEELARQEAETKAVARAASEERRRIESEQLRKERDQLRLEAKRERLRLRQILVERHDHFIGTTPDKPDAQRLHVLASMDLLCQRLSNMQLKDLNDRLGQAASSQDACATFNSETESVKRDLQAPGFHTQPKSDKVGGGDTTKSASASSCNWSSQMNQTLIKAVNLLPAGTPKRWEAIAAYVDQHCDGASISGKEALKQAKSLKQDDESLRRSANTKAFDSFSSTVRETDAVKNVTITNEIEAECSRPWTLTEQKVLEQALRTCPAQVNTQGSADRWQRIADVVATRTRRECMLRCKLLADQVKAKKAALAAASATHNGNSKATVGEKTTAQK